MIGVAAVALGILALMHAVLSREPPCGTLEAAFVDLAPPQIFYCTINVINIFSLHWTEGSDMMGQEPTRQVIVSGSKSAPLRQVIQERISILADHNSTGSYEFFIHEAEQGAGPPPHFHPWDEAFLVMEGEIEFMYGDQVKTLGAGSFIHFPAGTVHGFRYASAKARLAAITSRAGAADFFTALDRDVGAEPDFPKIVAIAGEHQVQVPPPPGAPA